MDEDVGSSLRQVAGSHYYARNLASDVEPDPALDRDTRADIERASATLARSLEVVAAAFTGPRDGTYTRASSLFDQAEQRLQRSSAPHQVTNLAIRDLRAIDETMAEMAEDLHLKVTDYDTVAGDALSSGPRCRGFELRLGRYFQDRAICVDIDVSDPPECAQRRFHLWVHFGGLPVRS
jgi:hypothetical protein